MSLFSVNGEGAEEGHSNLVEPTRQHSKSWFNRLPLQSKSNGHGDGYTRMGTLQLVGMMFFSVCGGPFGLETVSAFPGVHSGGGGGGGCDDEC
jgi:hypothetical protein